MVEAFANRYVPGGAGEGIDLASGEGTGVAALVRSAGTDAQATGAGVVGGGNVTVGAAIAGVGVGETISGAHAIAATARRIAGRLIASDYHSGRSWFATAVSAGPQFAFRPLHACTEGKQRRLK